MGEFFSGIIFGLITSGAVAVWYDKSLRPLLEIVIDPDGKVRGREDMPPHYFHHLKVRNRKACWPFSGRRPAWSCRIGIEVLDTKGNRIIQDSISARFTSQPEPLTPGSFGAGRVNYVDFAKMMTARKADVHGHEDQQISVAIKFERESDCYIFSNESYMFPPKWQNPAWRLGIGTYRLRVTAYYERGRARGDFELRNMSNSCEDFCLKPCSERR